jgi:hypothetical protein
MTTRPAIARLKVTLEDVEPAVMRRLDVPLKIRLDRLHLVLQAAMGWTNSHLYELRAGGAGWGVPDPDFHDGPLPAAKTTLFDVTEDTGARTIHYLYDFGDGWNHAVRIERIGEPDPQALYPQLVAATGRCPPEDVGGPWGYAEFLAAIADCRSACNVDPLMEWAPRAGQQSGSGFDHGPGVLLLKDGRAQVAEGRVQPPAVIDVVEEAG